MSTRFYDTDLTDAAWAWVAPVLPGARPGGRPRTTNLRAILNAIFYLLVFYPRMGPHRTIGPATQRPYPNEDEAHAALARPRRVQERRGYVQHPNPALIV